MRSRVIRRKGARTRLLSALAAAGYSLFAAAGSAIAGPKGVPSDPPHPLATRYPDRLVVVCEAGCPDHRGPEIVYMQRAPQQRVAVEGRVVPTSARLDDSLAASTNVIECIAGCYDTPKFYRAPIIPTRPLALDGTAYMSTLPADSSPQKRGPFSPVR